MQGIEVVLSTIAFMSRFALPGNDARPHSCLSLTCALCSGQDSVQASPQSPELVSRAGPSRLRVKSPVLQPRFGQQLIQPGEKLLLLCYHVVTAEIPEVRLQVMERRAYAGSAVALGWVIAYERTCVPWT